MSLVDTAAAGSWDTLKLSPFVSQTLQSLSFTSMTPVQASVIPLFLDNHKDVVVQAVTGSGKTLAFTVPLLEKLARRETPLKDDQVGGIIICPTRELAMQTHKVVQDFLNSQAATMDSEGSTSKQQFIRPALLLIGGNSTLKEDIQSFRSHKSDILVGTPGRLEEFLLGSSSLAPSNTTNSKGKRKAAAGAAATSAAASHRPLRSVCNVKELEMLIMDEADRVLELGYHLSINRILSILPKQRRTGCFSATMSEGLGELCRVGLRNPVRIVVKVERKAAQKSSTEQQVDRNTPASLQNTYTVCKPQEKLLRLLGILQSEALGESGDARGPKKILVFFATCACVDYFYKLLTPLPQLSAFTVYSLHGQQSPSKRTSTYNSFLVPAVSAKSPHQVLLCTDVAARGLDLPSVDTVVQFDPPQDPKQFNHRAGRTARAGRDGKAVVLLCAGREEEYVEFLSRRGVPLRPEPHTPSLIEAQSSKTEKQLRKIILSDRDLSEKGAKAFVSFVRSYSKHEASFIFSLKEYDLLGLARCFGLLRLPKMPELKEISKREDDPWHDAEVDWDNYAYEDKMREKARMDTLAVEKAARSDGQEATAAKIRQQPPKPTQAWSLKADAKERKELRREKKARKRAFLKAQEGGIDNQDGKPANGVKRANVDGSGEEGDEDDDPGSASDSGTRESTAADKRAAKRAKKAGVPRTEFSIAFGGE